jgi:hypothetical protein
MRDAIRAALLSLAIMGCPMLHAATITVEHAGYDALDAAARDRFIAVDHTPAQIRLAKSYLVTNETGVTGKCFDPLGKEGFARIRFNVPIPGFDRALLLIYNSYTYKDNHPKTLAVNAHERPYVHDEARMLTGGWARHDVPADELKTGLNDVVIGGTGGLHVDTFSHNGASSRSSDGGKTFKPDALGPDGNWSGEYIVRLRVYGHPPSGDVTSPVVDAACAPTDPKVRPNVAVRTLTLKADQSTPQGTQIAYAVRSGSTPIVTGRSWNTWRTIAPGESIPIHGHRYLQWHARLTTDSSQRTPVIRSVRLVMQADLDRPDLAGLHVDAYDNPTLSVGSYPFTWESDTPRIRHLREKYNLTDVVNVAADELTQQSTLRKWVSRQWKDGWDLGKYNYVPPWDALELLELAPRNLSLGMCTHYSCTFVQTATAVGFSARSVIIDHHCVAEVWSNELGKWVLQDTGPGPGPEGYPVSFAYQADGKWLNALDVHRALIDKRPVTAVPLQDLKQPYTLDQKWMDLFVRFAIPLLNNHLSQPAPAEFEHGHEQYRWDRYVWWTDSLDDPTYPEYSYLTDRVADFYYNVNEVAVDLQQSEPHKLVANLATHTPNLSRYEAAIDDAPWRTVESGFPWPLHDGTNRLRVRSVNVFGRPNRPTTVAITMRGANP